MSEYAEHIAKHRRLAILRFLADAETANDSVINTAISVLGFERATRSEIRDDLTLLESRGLLRVEWVGDLMVTDITERGVEVSQGKIVVPEVQKPSIGRRG